MPNPAHFSRSLLVCIYRIFKDFESANMDMFAVVRELSNPALFGLVPANAFVATGIFPCLAVPLVLLGICFAQVIQPIVEPIAIYMVDDLGRPISIVKCPDETGCEVGSIVEANDNDPSSSAPSNSTGPNGASAFSVTQKAGIRLICKKLG